MGLERLEARFTGHAYDDHRHDTYALGLTMTGVQSFDYRGARHDSAAGQGPRLSLADAALCAGFADQSHFTRQFKRSYGLTPGRWRAITR